MKIILTFLMAFILFAVQPDFYSAQKRVNAQISKYNVIWEAPSDDFTGSMPLGNGDISINAWVEPTGDLVFYIGKTDSWDDYGRLLKIGRVRISLNPKPNFPLESFTQTQNLIDATMVVNYGKGDDAVEMKVWVDANNPIIQVEIRSIRPTEILVTNELWRTEKQELPSIEVSDVMFDWEKDEHQHGPTMVEPDSILQGMTGSIGWFHHNSKSVGPAMCAEIQGTSDFERIDPLLNRTFGALISAKNARVIDPKNLKSPLSDIHQINIQVLTLHPSSPQQWLDSILVSVSKFENLAYDKRRQAHKKWWENFWNRSWINVTSNKPEDSVSVNDAFLVSRAYALQRFINACGGRGAYPIKFNGSIFNVPFAGSPGDADYRRWGPGYWWQNTRFPYIGMCSSGDFDLMKPLFKMYCDDLLPLFRYRTQKYLGHQGAFIPECVYFWGDYFSETYGWEPFENRTDKLQPSGWHKYEWVSGLELAFMMLEYYDFTQDTSFLQHTVLPFAYEILTFFNQHYKTNEIGKMVMHPSQSAETWWDCTNPMPEIAGLHAVTKALLNLPDNLTSAEQRDFWKLLKTKIPDLPVRENNGIKMLAPADEFANKMNVENPEVYAVFPFKLITMRHPQKELGVNAVFHREEHGNMGWRYEDIVMAYLGMADSAKNYLTGRVKNFDKNSRYPAFWGPNFDWTPDQCHGGVVMKTLQAMAMQTEGDSIFLFPAWPSDWDVDFRLHAPGNTIVDAERKDGKITILEVYPPEMGEKIQKPNYKSQKSKDK